MLSEKFGGMEVIDDKQDFTYPICQKLIKKNMQNCLFKMKLGSYTK